MPERCECSLAIEFNPFDVSTKELVRDSPADWLERYGIGPRGPVAVIDSVDRLEALGGWILDTDVHDWAELLQIS